MFKTFFLALITLGFWASSARAAVSLQFVNDGFISNLANASGVATNGMQWGIVISTTNGTFSGGGTSYGSVANIAAGGFLTFGGNASDDYYIPGGLTQDSTGVPETNVGGSLGAPGTLGDDIANIALTGDASGLGLGAGITTGAKFGIMWFATNGAEGAKYGFFTDPSFTIPGNGSTVDISAAFVGPDVIRTASSTIASATVIPEPSRAFLLLGGVLGLAMRRRRA